MSKFAVILLSSIRIRYVGVMNAFDSWKENI